jgi:hypothetical protein
MGLRKVKGWIHKPSPKARKYGFGWCNELNEALVDEKLNYCVMIRQVETEWGTVEHACIRNTKSTDIPWAEKQRIKNEVFGSDACAIEVYPDESKLVDAANMYHIWILPKGFQLPFGLK